MSSTTSAGPDFRQSLNGIPVRSITQPGQVVYWVVFGLMAGSAVCFAIITFLKPVHERSHGYVTLLIVTVASCAYYAMATQGGQIAISQEDQYQTVGTNRLPILRSVYWARYIDWFITTPLLLLDLLLICAAPVGTVLWIIACDILMIVTGLFGALCSHKFKWGWFGAGCLFQILLVYGMLVAGTGHARARGKVTGNSKLGITYLGLTTYLLLTWWGYPITFGFCEGANHASVTAEAACYGGLDLAAKVIFGWMIMAVYPIISRQNREEYARGTYLPPLLSAPINGVLYPAAVPMSQLQARYHGPGANKGTLNPAQATTAAPFPTTNVGNGIDGVAAAPASTTASSAV